MKCPYCDGKKKVYLHDPCRGSWETCRVCRGTGVFKTKKLVRVNCPECRGAGQLSNIMVMFAAGNATRCGRCHGTGKILKYRKIKLKL